MNEQMMKVLTALLGLAGTYLVTNNVVDPAQWATASGQIMAVVGGLATLWSIGYTAWKATHKQTLASASAVPGVQTIVVNTMKASDGAVAAVADPNLTKIVKTGTQS